MVCCSASVHSCFEQGTKYAIQHRHRGGAAQNNDIVGIMVLPSSVGQSYNDANRAIVSKQGAIEGRAQLIYIP